MLRAFNQAEEDALTAKVEADRKRREWLRSQPWVPPSQRRARAATDGGWHETKGDDAPSESWGSGRYLEGSDPYVEELAAWMNAECERELQEDWEDRGDGFSDQLSVHS